MKRLCCLLALAMLAVTPLAGCEINFGDDDDCAVPPVFDGQGQRNPHNGQCEPFGGGGGCGGDFAFEAPIAFDWYRTFLTTMLDGGQYTWFAKLVVAGEILIGDATELLVRDAVQTEPVEPLSLKGKAEPVPAHRLVEVVSQIGQARRALTSKMVGRDRELEDLSRARRSYHATTYRVIQAALDRYRQTGAAIEERRALGRSLGQSDTDAVCDDALRRLHLEHVFELARHRVEALLPESETHAPLRAELVDQERTLRALDVPEEKRRAAALDDAVRDLRDLEVRVDLGLDGLFLLGGDEHCDNHTFIDHAAPHGTSRELYKGVLADRAHGVFNGRILVRKAALKTDARQVSRNLLLDRDALVDTKPQLEILADDVKCSHGATIGQLDADALFYLRSRGIAETEARSLLTYAFASEVVRRVRPEPVRARMREALAAIRADLGTEAVMLSSRKVGSSVEVIAAVDVSTHLCMVGMLDALSVKDTKIGLETLAQMGYDPSAVTLILNRADSDVGITPADVEELLGRAPDLLVGSDRVARALRISVTLAVVGATAAMLLSSVVAYLTVRLKVTGRGVLEGLAFVPWAFPGTALAIGLLWSYVRFPIPIYATIWILLIAYITIELPAAFQQMQSAFRTVHPELEDASRILGATALLPGAGFLLEGSLKRLRVAGSAAALAPLRATARTSRVRRAAADACEALDRTPGDPTQRCDR